MAHPAAHHTPRFCALACSQPQTDRGPWHECDMGGPGVLLAVCDLSCAVMCQSGTGARSMHAMDCMGNLIHMVHMQATRTHSPQITDARQHSSSSACECHARQRTHTTHMTHMPASSIHSMCMRACLPARPPPTAPNAERD